MSGEEEAKKSSEMVDTEAPKEDAVEAPTDATDGEAKTGGKAGEEVVKTEEELVKEENEETAEGEKPEAEGEPEKEDKKEAITEVKKGRGKPGRRKKGQTAAEKGDDDKPEVDAANEEAVKDEAHQEEKADKEEPKEGRGAKRGKRKVEGETTEPEVETKREKRTRKSAEVFAPEDFKHADKPSLGIEGRGKKLGEIPSVRQSIEKHPAGSDVIMMAHRLLFATRGKPPKKDLKPNILQFSGFLEKKKEGLSKKDLDKQDEDAEAKMSAKAFKLTVPHLKKLIDFFAIDRSGHGQDKDALVGCLLDFLGAPGEEGTKGTKGASRKGNSKQVKKAAEEEDGEDDDDGLEVDEEPPKGGEMPSDDALHDWVRAYVKCFNLDKATVAHAMEVARDKFGVDLTEKKDVLKEFLTSETLSG